MMQVQIQQSHGVDPAPSPREQLCKLCLHFSKPKMKNINELSSQSHTTALSFTAAIWHWKPNLGRQIWRFKQRWHGCCLNLQIMERVGLSYSCTKKHLLPAVNTSNPIPRWSKLSGIERNTFWANYSWQTLRLVTSIHTMPSSTQGTSMHVRVSLPSQVHLESSLSCLTAQMLHCGPYVQLINQSPKPRSFHY